MTKMAAIQMEVTSNKEQNLEKAKKWLEKAAAAGANLACLPEYFLADCPEAGQSREAIQAIAETIPGPATSYLSEIAKKTGMIICAGSFIAKDADGTFRNTSALIDASGKIIGTYSKTHPENANPKYEVGAGIKAGDDYPVFDTEVGKVGIIIDMDATTAEAARILYVRGAEIVLWPLNWSTRWLQPVEILPAAHAMMNKQFVLASNRVGTRKSAHGTFLYNGGSKICNPEGFVVARAGDFYEGFAINEIDIKVLRDWRNVIIPRDYPLRRRPETYGAITEPWSVA